MYSETAGSDSKHACPAIEVNSQVHQRNSRLQQLFSLLSHEHKQKLEFKETKIMKALTSSALCVCNVDNGWEVLLHGKTQKFPKHTNGLNRTTRKRKAWKQLPKFEKKRTKRRESVKINKPKLWVWNVARRRTTGTTQTSCDHLSVDSGSLAVKQWMETSFSCRKCHLRRCFEVYISPDTGNDFMITQVQSKKNLNTSMEGNMAKYRTVWDKAYN